MKTTLWVNSVSCTCTTKVAVVVWAFFSWTLLHTSYRYILSPSSRPWLVNSTPIWEIHLSASFLQITPWKWNSVGVIGCVGTVHKCSSGFHSEVVSQMAEYGHLTAVLSTLMHCANASALSPINVISHHHNDPMWLLRCRWEKKYKKIRVNRRSCALCG